MVGTRGRMRQRWIGSLGRPGALALVVAIATLLLALAPPLALPTAAQDTGDNSNSDNQFANVQLPDDWGQTDIQVYVPQTGHTLTGIMLDYWRANGTASVYGNPISEPFAAANGYYSQAFQDAVFQYRPEYAHTEQPMVRLMPISQTALTDRLDTFRPDGRRGGGGGDRDAAAWTALPQSSPTVQQIVGAGGQYVADTGHTISGDFLKWYNFNEGSYYLGNPLSQPVAERGMTVQYFDGALLMEDAQGQMGLAPLAQELAPELGIDTKRVSQGDLPVYSEELFQGIGIQPTEDDLANAGQDGVNYLQIIGDLNAPGRKWVEVSLSKLQLWAYQGNTAVMTTLVSTGLDPNPTAPGDYHVYWKLNMQTMEGYTDSSGVNWGDTEPPGGGYYWIVPNIPNVMYFSLTGDALHGTYWHHNFGNPMSHGCVNLPLQVAAWMYGWAPLGTEVWVHQ